jgi:D-threonate/D-erythronate kinase
VRRLATVIADDLSGAADCGAAFAAFGLDTFVALGGTLALPPARVVALDTDSREAPSEVAAGRVRSAALRALGEGSQALYKKIDSTLRGNVGAEVAAAYRAAVEALPGPRPLVVATPAFPSAGRIVRRGRVLVAGVPLEETLGAQLRTFGLKVGTTRLTDPDELQRELERLAQGGVEAVVCDAEDETDLRAIARAGAGLPRPVVWVGSAGLARHLPAALGLRPHDAPEKGAEAERAAGPLLFLVGSRSAMAREQARRLAAEAGVESVVVSPETLRAGEGGAGWAEAQECLSRALAAGHDVVLVVGAAGDQISRPDALLAAAMGRLAAGAPGVGGLLATGGDMARAALLARGANGLRLLGEVEPGVPLGLTDEPRPMPVITKAGAFGTPSTLQRCRGALRQPTRSLTA